MADTISSLGSIDYRHEVVARVPESTLEDLNDALNAAVTARPTIAAMLAYERADRTA